MNLIEPTHGLALLIAFGLAMVGLVWLRTHTERHADGFLVADRKVGVVQGAFSIAVSWIWAPAIFVCSMQAFNLGLAGIFYFTLPNILTFFLFVPIAMKLRKEMPKGYTLPEYIYERFSGNKAVHIAFVIGFILSMLVAVVANAYAGGTLLNAISGIDRNVAIIAMAVIALAYSLMSGLKASIFTDVIQMAMVLVLAFVIVPLCLSAVGGIEIITNNLGGIQGEHGTVFHPAVAFAMGIPMAVTLFTGPVADQMFIQRAMAVKEKSILPTFVFGGLLFGLVPITLSLLGFIGVELVNAGRITVESAEMVGPLVIAELLPTPFLYIFALMAFAALCSTLDSALCALSSLGAVDVYKRYVEPEAKDKRLLKASRVFMVLMALVGIGIALLKPSMLWTFMIGGAVTAALFFPTIFALFVKRTPAWGTLAAVVLSLVFAVPVSIYANVQGDTNLIVASSLGSVLIGLVVCLLSALVNRK